MQRKSSDFLSGSAKTWLRSYMMRYSHSVPEVAQQINLNPRLLYSMLAGGPVSRKSGDTLRVFFDAKAPEIPLLASAAVDSTKVWKNSIIYSNHLLREYLFEANTFRRRAEVRNLVSSASLSKQLIALEEIPSLSEAMTNTQKFVGYSVTDKDIGSPHFINLSVIVQFVWPDQPEPILLSYFRCGPMFDNFTRFPNRAIAWNFSFLRQADLPTAILSPAEEWLETVVAEPALAEEKFLNGPDSVLCRLLYHKLMFQTYHHVNAKQLGIMNQTLNKGLRVHSAYVFVVTVSLKNAQEFSREVLAIPSQFIPVEAIPLSLITEEKIKEESNVSQPSAPEPQGSGINTALLKALCSPNLERFTHGKCSFRRGFDLLPRASATATGSPKH